MVLLPVPNHDGFVGKLRCQDWRLGKIVKFFGFCIFCTLILALILALSPISVDNCNCPTPSELQSVIKPQLKYPSMHKLAVLVPFRDRFEELLTFAPYMHKFLKIQRLNFEIYVLNQVDGFRFNRASLINVGFHVSRNECDYIAMHDVDLLPLNGNLSYRYPKSGPFHIASPTLHPRYHYATFVGGILLVKREDFEKVNGMSNQYWGWGLEDDEFYVRLNQAGLNVTRPINITTGTENTFRHTHDKVRRKRDMAKCFNQREVTRRRDRKTGLKDVAYAIQSVRNVSIDDVMVKVINIELKCDKLSTPWCDCGESISPQRKSSSATQAKSKKHSTA